MFKQNYHPHFEPISVGSAVVAGASLLGSGGQMIAQGKMNRKTRAWNEKMIHRQRDWALSDWNMTNEYNSPLAQMQRLREAGLNPNLVYGNGATATGGDVRKTDTPSWNPQTPDVQGAVGNALQAFYDVQTKEAQLGIMNAQQADIREAALLKAAQRLKVGTDTGYTDFRLNRDKGLLDVYSDTQRENLRRLRIGSDIQLQENERRIALTAQSLKEGAERILTARLGRDLTQKQIEQANQTIKNLKLDQRTKELENHLRELGINPSDPVWMRVLGQIVGSVQGELKGILKESKQAPGALKNSLKYGINPFLPNLW